MIRILTDSASDILPAEAEQLGVTVIPLNVTLEVDLWQTIFCVRNDPQVVMPVLTIEFQQKKGSCILMRIILK